MSPTKEYRELRRLRGDPITEPKRPGDRHKGKHAKGSQAPSKWDRRLIVGWDGEGATLANGEHIYNLLANSDGSRVVNSGGLSTEEALDFFLTFGDPKAINVIYGGSYDVNMILRDLSHEKLLALWHLGSCYWQNYRIFYAPRKKFTVKKLIRTADGDPKMISFVLWDVLGYFQTTFVAACRKWLGNSPILDEIERMKGQRSEFTQDKIEDIIQYNKTECELLVQLMHALFDALDDADIKLRRYDGAGSIATALLGKNHVLEHKGEPNEEVLKWAQYAYSGGRIEAVKVGNAETQPVYRSDINSAYPYSCLGLPSYRGAYWTFDSEWDGSDNSMVKLVWSIPGNKMGPFTPLWYREFDGTILYPGQGYGIYWGAEARRMLRDYERYVHVESACNCHLDDELTRPFAYLSHIYDARLELKQAGNMAAEAFKLGMNSTYGKLAQQAGYRNGRIPRYHQLLWAGQVTAATRSQLYDAAMEDPDSVIAFATDAVISTTRFDLTEGTGLGEWTIEDFNGITIVQPGVYWLRSANGSWADKYRGFDKGSLMRERIVDCWRKGEPYEAHLTRFVGMGSALSGGHKLSPDWRSWRKEQRNLSLIPSGKRMPLVEDILPPNNGTCYADRLCATLATPNMHGVEIISKPYPLLWDPTTPSDSVYDELAKLENDLMDSYA